MILRHTVFQNFAPKSTKNIFFNDTGQFFTGTVHRKRFVFLSFPTKNYQLYMRIGNVKKIEK